ncbi:MAG: chromate transporter [Prevotella sp.]|nr:chromate transporter [Prevotella sp.]MDD7189967.1 chromate transporter [Prevotella sp.]MDY5314721.1 chromate transporter [Prevotella sp.]
MIFLKLFWTFFKIGLFGFGGGYGMLSLIQMETVHNHHWLTSAEFTNIVAISQMTPGPIGINSATYCGFTAIHNMGMGNALSVLGSLVATFSLVLPSFVLMILISKMFMRYMKARVVQSVFDGLRPAVVGLLAAATIMLLNKENFGSPVDTTWQFIISVLLFAATFYGTLFVKINPIKMIGYAAIAGLLLLY